MQNRVPIMRHTLRGCALAFVGAVLVAACSGATSTKSSSTTAVPSSVPFTPTSRVVQTGPVVPIDATEVGQGSTSEQTGSFARGVIVRSQAELVRVIGTSTNLAWASRFPYRDRAMLVVFGGAQPTLGYQVTVPEVFRQGTELIARMQLISPNPDLLQAEAFSEPYVALSIAPADAEGVTYIDVQVTKVRER